MSNCFIGDGYTIDGYFEASKGNNPNGAILHDEFRFSYRPILPEDRASVIDEVSKAKSNVEIERTLAKHLAKYLVSWSATDVPISQASVLRLRPPILSRLVSVVIYNRESGDTEPVSNLSDDLKN